MKNKNSKHNIVNKTKLIFIPLIVALISILSVSSATFYISKTSLLKQMNEDGINLVKQVANQLSDNHNSLETINEMLEDKIRVASNVLIKNQNNLSNEFLKDQLKKLKVDELHWMNKEGKILYSTVEGYIDWIPYKGHPLYDFVLSDNLELMEAIRPDAKFGNFMKYGSVKNIDGNFVQVGILANNIETLTKKFSYQNLIEGLMKKENIIYALLVDNNLKAIADSNKENIGIIYKDDETLKEALKGNTFAKEWYYDKTQSKVLDIAIPVFLEGKITGAINIGLSMNQVYLLIYKNFFISLIITISMGAILFIIMRKNIIEPVNKLNENIMEIDLENNLDYRLPLFKNDTFFGISYSINKILDETYMYFHKLMEHQVELNVSNEELSATYQQLSASEEELRAQYKEIQSYTEKLENLTEKYNIAIKGTNSAVWEIDLESNTICLFNEFKNITDVSFHGKEDLHKVFDKIFYSEDKQLLIEEYLKYKRNETQEIYYKIRTKSTDENFRWILINGKGIFDSLGNIKQLTGIALDITNLKKQEEHIEYLANHDVLTGLPNRRSFIKKLEEQLNAKTQGAIMLLDIDNFKAINDSLGHIYGDITLKQVGESLIKISGEEIFVFRFGGDEFLILLPNIQCTSTIEKYANKIMDLFKNIFLIKDSEFHLSFSMGITLYPRDGEDTNQLLMNADTAMYKIKTTGKNNYAYFNKEMVEELNEKIKIEKMLRDALIKEEFVLVYQPQISLETGLIASFEALLRLKNYNISPSLFIPIAEESGLVLEIGRWVAREVIHQLAELKNKGFQLKPIAINLSAKQVNDKSYISFIRKTLEENDVDSKYLEIEITESILLKRTSDSIEFLNNLKETGVKITLDDFGTGYSSLFYLTFVPVSKIKLDKSLNDKLLELTERQVMEKLISLAHSLNLEVTAEGIEKIEHYRYLRLSGCDYIQGYIFSKPLYMKEIEKIYYDNFLDKI